MKAYKLRIVTPTGVKYEGDALSLTARGVAGELTVLADHMPFVTFLKEGQLRFKTDESTQRTAYISGGILTVGKETELLATSFSDTTLTTDH